MSSIASSILTQTARRQALRTATSARTPFVIVPAFRQLSTSRVAAMPMNEYNKPVATIDASLAPRLPAQSISLFEAKKAKKLTFEEIGAALGRGEVAVAALFYGQAHATEEDVTKLSQLLDLDEAALKSQMYGLPDRGRTLDLPPKEPLIYRLFEIVQNYGYPFKAVINEKFGDGIMSAITFSTKVEKETDEKGDWVKITLRGKWLPYSRF